MQVSAASGQDARGKGGGSALLRVLSAGLSAARNLLAADDDHPVQSIFQRADALSEEGKMVLRTDRRDPGAASVTDSRSPHCPRRGHRNDVFELRQRVYVRRTFGSASGQGVL